VTGVARYCFQLQVRPDRIAAYRERHRTVWPEMLAALRDTGWRNYSLFLRPDGLLIGYVESDDLAAAQAAMAATAVNARWQAEMAPFFVNLDGRRTRASSCWRRSSTWRTGARSGLPSPGRVRSAECPISTRASWTGHDVAVPTDIPERRSPWMSTSTVARPGSVTVVVVLVWISAILAIIGGLLLLLFAPAAPGNVGRGFVVAVGVIVLLIGLLTAAVASRLAKGGNGARMIVSILEVLQIAGNIATLTTGNGASTTTQALINIVLNVVILALLWNSRANAFFAAR